MFKLPIKTVKFRARFQSSNGGAVATGGDDVTVQFSHSVIFQGLSIRHAEFVPVEGSRDGTRKKFVTTRSAVGNPGDAGTQEYFDAKHYTLRTVYGSDVLTATTTAVRQHLGESLPKRHRTDAPRTLADQFESIPGAREEYLNSIVEPTATAILAACLEPSLLENIDSSNTYKAYPLWALEGPIHPLRDGEAITTFSDVYLLDVASEAA